MELPAYYTYDTKFVPHMKDHVVSLSHHILPNFEYNIQTTFQDGTFSEDKTFNDIYNIQGKHAILKLERAYGRRGFL